MGNETTNEKIKNGQGLNPLPSEQSPKQSGNTTEQRGQESGVRRDIFTKQGAKTEGE